MTEADRPSEQAKRQSLPSTAAGSEWEVEGYGEALTARPEQARDLALGNGIRWTLPSTDAPNATELELFPERGIVRLTNQAEGVQVTLFGQSRPPRITKAGLVFEQPEPTRWLSVGKDGSATLFLSPAADEAVSVMPSDRSEPAAARPISRADTPPLAKTHVKEKPERGRIQGNLVYDPEFKVTSRQRREIAAFVVAEHYTDENGAQQTIYHRCAAFNNDRRRLADLVRDQAGKGDEVIVHGNWHTVEIRYQNGTTKQERQLWAYGLKVVSKQESW